MKSNFTSVKSDFQSYIGSNRSLPDSLKYQYLGMEKCATACHNNDSMGFQYNIVKSSPHAKAYEILSSVKAKRYAKNSSVKGNPQESFTCLKCHVTGAGLDSTSLTSTYRKEDGVTCEACHKGEFIKKTFLPKESDCLKCHNSSVHKVNRFDFKEECEKIAHSRPKSKNVTS
jgi:hypothetical protein